MHSTVAEISQAKALADQVVAQVQLAVIGKDDLLRRIMAGFLAGGHILIEDFPGLGKTLMAKSFAQALGLEFKRIQFTPDLLPADITGTHLLSADGKTFELRRGPIFANVLLADEINRASPKTQSALLEAMQEFQVTLEGQTLMLPLPFAVIATQNPIEYEGTFPLPEAQLDRFMIRLQVGYPHTDHERQILAARRQRRQDEFDITSVADAAMLLGAREQVERIHVDDDIERYIVELVDHTRNDRRVAVGASPRGSLALMKMARAWAAIHGRGYVLPDDVKTLAKPALVHRILLQPEHWMKRNTADDVVDSALATVPVPVLEGV